MNKYLNGPREVKLNVVYPVFSVETESFHTQDQKLN